MLKHVFINYKNKSSLYNNKIKKKYKLSSILKNKYNPNTENLVFKFKSNKIKNHFNN